MGCDIHVRIECRDGMGNWHKVPFHTQYDVDCPSKYSPVEENSILVDGLNRRNYNFFAVLANVRNETWSDRIPPIAEPRGLPSDLSGRGVDADGCHMGSDYDWEFGDHSLSYITLQELLDYSWDQIIINRGFVSDEFVNGWDGKTPPSSYAGWSNRGQQVEWQNTVKGMVGAHIFESIIPTLRQLGDPEDVRLVFGFDN